MDVWKMLYDTRESLLYSVKFVFSSYVGPDGNGSVFYLIFLILKINVKLSGDE